MKNKTEDQPQIQCPSCGEWEDDFDGFMVAHTKPAYKNGCGWCGHAARSNTVCEYCGEFNETGMHVCRNFDPDVGERDDGGKSMGPNTCRICGFAKNYHGWNTGDMPLPPAGSPSSE